MPNLRITRGAVYGPFAGVRVTVVVYVPVKVFAGTVYENGIVTVREPAFPVLLAALKIFAGEVLEVGSVTG